MKIHQKRGNSSGILPHVCRFCGKSFMGFYAQETLKNHEKLHDGKGRLHKCSFCDKTFNSASIRFRHESVHTGVWLHKCTRCAKSFPELYQRLEHERKVHNFHDEIEQYFECNLCGKSFPSAFKLNRHEIKNSKTEFTCANPRPKLIQINKPIAKRKSDNFTSSPEKKREILVAREIQVCIFCEVSFPTGHKLDHHLRSQSHFWTAILL